MDFPKLLPMCAAVAFTAGGLTISASPAAGQPPVVVKKAVDRAPVRRVSFADLDLATAAGQKALHGRVNSAVNGVCYETVGLSAVAYEFRSCRSGSWSAARPQIGRAIERAEATASIGGSNLAVSTITVAAQK